MMLSSVPLAGGLKDGQQFNQLSSWQGGREKGQSGCKPQRINLFVLL
jgi:hypothetical protein